MMMPEEECAAVRRATGTGEPLGSPEFLRSLERAAGRRLRVLDRGRPRKRSGGGEPPGLQESLFESRVSSRA